MVVLTALWEAKRGRKSGGEENRALVEFLSESRIARIRGLHGFWIKIAHSPLLPIALAPTRQDSHSPRLPLASSASEMNPECLAPKKRGNLATASLNYDL